MAAGITTSSSTICDGNPATPKFFYDANSAAAYDLNSAVNNDDTLPPERRAAWALVAVARDVGSAIHRYRLALLVARERERNDILPF